MHWEPNYSIFEEQDHACTDFTRSLLLCYNSVEGQSLIINQIASSTTVDADDLTADYNFAAMLLLDFNVTVDQLSSNPTNSSVVYDISNSTNRYGTIQFNKRKQFDDNTLARRWEIYSDNSRATVKYMTQQRVRSVLYPTLFLQYPTNDRMLQYKLMPHPVFSVT